jgi:hypothetical protein
MRDASTPAATPAPAHEALALDEEKIRTAAEALAAKTKQPLAEVVELVKFVAETAAAEGRPFNPEKAEWALMDMAAAAAKPKRGRPKGSKNKPKQLAA